MSIRAERSVRDSRSFAEGAARQKAGGVIGDNPHTSGTPEWRAWNNGFRVGVGSAAWVTATAYDEGVLVTNNGNTYECVVAGTSGATGPSGTQQRITDGTAVWQFTAVGSLVDLSTVARPTANGAPYVATFNAKP